MAEQISATYNAKDDEGNVVDSVNATIQFNLGEDLEEAVKLFGEEVILSLFRQTAVIKAQSQLRACLKAEKDEEGIAAHFATWKPGIAVARVPKDAKAEGRKAFERMNAEERVSYLEELQAIVDAG